EIEGLVQQTTPSTVGFLMDAGHVHRAHADPAAFFVKHSKRIVALHLRDSRDGKEVPLGMGQIDYRPLVEAAEKSNWAGWVLPEEIEYIREHVLRKPLGVVHIWALGVGVVITGEYFGWNFGLPVGGPMGVLLASLIVCVLYLTWVLALSELSVAMPFAGGPLAYGRRAFGPPLGFLMGWSMFLECQFATIATALATGGYVAFALNPDNPSPEVKV